MGNYLFSCFCSVCDTDSTKSVVEEPQFIKTAQKINLLKIKNFAFSGGGISGVLYLGVYKRMQELNLKFDSIAGTSIGSLFATLYSLNCPYKTLENKFMNLNTIKLIDGSINLIKDLESLEYGYGFCSGKYLEDWVESIIFEVSSITNLTFDQAWKKYQCNLVIPVWNESLRISEYWSYKTKPDFVISRAIRCSTSLPIIYDPIMVDGYLYCDGGIGNNYPLNIFPKESTMGAILVDYNTQDIKQNNTNPQVIDSFINNISAVVEGFKTISFNLQHPEDDNWRLRSIILPGLDKKSYDFSLSDNEKSYAISRSYEECCKFI